VVDQVEDTTVEVEVVPEVIELLVMAQVHYKVVH
jgi:hypothetical protein